MYSIKKVIMILMYIDHVGAITFLEPQSKSKIKKEKKTTVNDVKKKRTSRSSSRKPEAYKRQKRL